MSYNTINTNTIRNTTIYTVDCCRFVVVVRLQSDPIRHPKGNAATTATTTAPTSTATSNLFIIIIQYYYIIYYYKHIYYNVLHVVLPVVLHSMHQNIKASSHHVVVPVANSAWLYVYVTFHVGAAVLP